MLGEPRCSYLPRERPDLYIPADTATTLPIVCPLRHSHDTVFLGPRGQSAGQTRGRLWWPRFPRSFESAVSFSPLHSFFRRTQVSPVIPLSVPGSVKQYRRGGHPPSVELRTQAAADASSHWASLTDGG